MRGARFGSRRVVGTCGRGPITLVDRDFVEPSNLQRQTMFTEADAEQRLPKAIAAANHLREINSEIEVEPHIIDVNHSNIERLIDDCDLVLDGTDNFATRYLINDACVKHEINWIYGAAVGSYGVTMTIRPHQTACLRCVFEEAPPAASAPTCDTCRRHHADNQHRVGSAGRGSVQADHRPARRASWLVDAV